LFRKLQATKEGAKRSLFGIAEDEAAERREKRKRMYGRSHGTGDSESEDYRPNGT
jgi:hypothetical protein